MGSASQAAGRGVSAFGGHFGFDRTETVRWAMCFLLVAGLHAMAALSFVRSPQSSEFEAGAPVVMLELPEMTAAPTTPPSDLAPGPPEMESEPTPPPKEETKPPEEEAEVALPTPEPPKPQPPVEFTRPPHRSGGRARSPPTSSASSAIRRQRVHTRNRASRRSHSPSIMRGTCCAARSCRAPGRPRSTRKPSTCWRAPSRCRSLPATPRTERCPSSFPCASISGDGARYALHAKVPPASSGLAESRSFAVAPREDVTVDSWRLYFAHLHEPKYI
jgi:hypothetical protein